MAKSAEKKLVENFLDKIAKSEKEWSTTTDGKSLRRSSNNTAIVIESLQKAAYETGFVALAMSLSFCEVEEKDSQRHDLNYTHSNGLPV